MSHGESRGKVTNRGSQHLGCKTEFISSQPLCTGTLTHREIGDWSGQHDQDEPLLSVVDGDGGGHQQVNGVLHNGVGTAVQEGEDLRLHHPHVGWLTAQHHWFPSRQSAGEVGVDATAGKL